jgi:hypothetical protein
MNYSKVWKQKITNDDGSIVITAQSLVITSSSNNTVRQKITVRTTSENSTHSDDTDSACSS